MPRQKSPQESIIESEDALPETPPLAADAIPPRKIDGHITFHYIVGPTVVAYPELGKDLAPVNYEVSNEGKSHIVSFKGPLNEDALLAIILDRVTKLQETPQKCRQLAMAHVNLQQAIKLIQEARKYSPKY